MQIGIHPTTAVLCILDVANHAVAAIIHQHDQQIGLFLHRSGQFADVHHQPAITTQAQHLAWFRIGPQLLGDGGTDAHLKALTDAAAQRMHTIARAEQLQQAIAPGAVGYRHITHPQRLAASDLLQTIDQRRIRRQALAHQCHRCVVRLAQIGSKGRVDDKATGGTPLLQPLGQALQRQRSIAADKLA